MNEPRVRARLPLARHRLRRADFLRVYKLGRRARGSRFTVIVHENGGTLTRLGLSVSKRHARRAVDRNRMRRILREAFRLELAGLPAGLDVVLVAGDPGRPPPLVEARAELVALVARALRKKPRAAAEEKER